MRREDYILRLIAESVRALHRMAGLANEGRHREALESADYAARHLVGVGLGELLRLGEGDLRARLSFGESSETARDRQLFLAALLRESGASFYALDATDDGDACNIMALRLLLDALARYGSDDLPEYAPDAGALVAATGLYRLPLDLYPPLVAHHERAGAFAAAEDALHALLDAAPGDAEALALGVGLYERLLERSDEALRAGELSRAEVAEALAELRDHR
jgi:hypothetical protein